ncbi:4112_t:CDS:2 [Paraglomus brasilianum]|uniref:4112_t:CDS:1 n=1 Tax=Paraglomus brasilianum TaxID=144538 RepID=A0A9N9H0F6_9GLOM|nr:4112_t:CDS:2 [Paraglomus brasilianum]
MDCPCQKKRKSTEINKSGSDATKIDESNVSNAPEDIEDVLMGDNIIDDKQVKEHNLEKSWEFKEPIPSWLKRLHQHCKDLATTTDTDLESLSQKGLKKVAKTIIHHGVCGAINKIRKILTTSNKVEDENPFLDSPPTEITTADNFVQDGDYKHPDVCYIIELLCYIGEMVSRASRQCHTQAIDASDKAEGYHLDWLFTKHDLAKDLTWGQEFSLCERAGSKIENGRKILDNTLKVQKTLHDMHQTLLETLSNAGGGAVPVKVAQAFRKLLLPGFISSQFFIQVLLNVYIGGKYHGSIMLAEFDVPTQFDEMSKIVTIAQMMLNVKNIFKQTIKTFTLMEEASKKKKHSVENVLVPSRIKEHVTPNAKKQKTSKTKNQ